jgi:hypothetical protein
MAKLCAQTIAAALKPPFQRLQAPIAVSAVELAEIAIVRLPSHALLMQSSAETNLRYSSTPYPGIQVSRRRLLRVQTEVSLPLTMILTRLVAAESVVD